MSIRMEGEVVPRFDHVVFDYLRLVGEASAAKDDTAYLNLVETLENLLLPLAGVEERKNLLKLHKAEVTLKKIVIHIVDKKLDKVAHDSIRRRIEKNRQNALHLIDMELAKVKLRLLGNVMRKTNIVQFKVGEAYSFEEDRELFAERLVVGLLALGFSISKEKILEVLK